MSGSGKRVLRRGEKEGDAAKGKGTAQSEVGVENQPVPTVGSLRHLGRSLSLGWHNCSDGLEQRTGQA